MCCFVCNGVTIDHVCPTKKGCMWLTPIRRLFNQRSKTNAKHYQPCTLIITCHKWQPGILSFGLFPLRKKKRWKNFYHFMELHPWCFLSYFSQFWVLVWVLVQSSTNKMNNYAPINYPNHFHFLRVYDCNRI